METFADLVRLQSEVVCPPFEFRVGCFTCGPLSCEDNHNNDGYVHTWWIEACLIRKDTHSDTIERGYGGRIAVPQHTSDDAVIKKFFVAARDYGEHEVREAFLYKGRRVLGPHIPLDHLWEAAGDD